MSSPYHSGSRTAEASLLSHLFAAAPPARPGRSPRQNVLTLPPHSRSAVSAMNVQSESGCGCVSSLPALHAHPARSPGRFARTTHAIARRATIVPRRVLTTHPRMTASLTAPPAAVTTTTATMTTAAAVTTATATADVAGTLTPTTTRRSRTRAHPSAAAAAPLSALMTAGAPARPTRKAVTATAAVGTCLCAARRRTLTHVQLQKRVSLARP